MFSKVKVIFTQPKKAFGGFESTATTTTLSKGTLIFLFRFFLLEYELICVAFVLVLQRYTPEKAFKELIPVIPALLEHLELTATKLREVKENDESDLVRFFFSRVGFQSHLICLIQTPEDCADLVKIMSFILEILEKILSWEDLHVPGNVYRMKVLKCCLRFSDSLLTP